MKSFVKFCLILAAAFGVLGILGLSVGMALGARPSEFLNISHYTQRVWHRNNNSLEDIEESLEEIAEDWDDTWDEAWDEDWDEDWDYLDEEWENHYMPHLRNKERTTSWDLDTFEASYGSADTKKLKLDLNKGVVKLYVHEEDDILIKGSNAQGYLEITENEDSLTIQDYRGTRREALHLEIYLPQRMLEKIEADLGAARIYAEELYAQEVIVDLGAGEALIDRINGDQIRVDLGAGSSTISEMMANKLAEIEVGTGELRVGSFEGGDLRLSCGIGSLYMLALGSETDYNYELSCGLGSLSLNGRSYSGLGHEQRIDNRADKKISMECGIGEMTLAFEN